MGGTIENSSLLVRSVLDSTFPSPLPASLRWFTIKRGRRRRSTWFVSCIENGGRPGFRRANTRLDPAQTQLSACCRAITIRRALSLSGLGPSRRRQDVCGVFLCSQSCSHAPTAIENGGYDGVANQAFSSQEDQGNGQTNGLAGIACVLSSLA